MFKAIELIVSVLLLSVLVFVDCSDKSFILVPTENGQIRGSISVTWLERREFYSFKGIPYAKPPTGERRFKVPEKATPWTNTLNTTRFGRLCLQRSETSDVFFGSEDCLFLNVFTPSVNSQQKLPVIFYIHGGAYFAGGSNVAGPEILLDEDIVLVTINYRLGPFGFLSLDRPEYSGNMGLKDQLLALQWVNDNIHNFGGDKDQITIYGHSAGSSSTNFHVLSPQSRGLFKRAILMSGSVYNQFAFESRNQTEILLKAMEKQNATTTGNVDDAGLLEWLQTVDATFLVRETFYPVFEEGLTSKRVDVVWGPVLERKDAVSPFFVKSPDVYFKVPSNIDTIFGFTSGESITFTPLEFNNPEKLKPFNEHFQIQAPLAHLYINKTSEAYKSFLKEIRQFYFGNKNVDGTTLNEYTRLLSDTFFIYGIDRAAKKQAKRSTGKTYYMQFSVELALNIFRQQANATELGVHGSGHIEDLPYVFRTRLVPQSFYDNLKKDSDEVRLIKSLRNYITNFVKYGNPNGNNPGINVIKPIDGYIVNYVNFLNDRLVAGVSPRRDSIRFWSRLLYKYARIIRNLIV